MFFFKRFVFHRQPYQNILPVHPYSASATIGGFRDVAHHLAHQQEWYVCHH